MPKEPSGGDYQLSMLDLAARFDQSVSDGYALVATTGLYEHINRRAETLINTSKEPIISQSGRVEAYAAAIDEFNRRLSPRARRALMEYLIGYVHLEVPGYHYTEEEGYATKFNPVLAATMIVYGSEVSRYIEQPLEDDLAQDEIMGLTRDLNETNVSASKTEADYLLQHLQESSQYAADMIDDSAQEAKTKLLKNRYQKQLDSFTQEVAKQGLGFGRDFLDRLEKKDPKLAEVYAPIYEDMILSEAADCESLLHLHALIEVSMPKEETLKAIIATWHAQIFASAYDMCAKQDFRGAMNFIDLHVKDQNTKSKMMLAIEHMRRENTDE